MSFEVVSKKAHDVVDALKDGKVSEDEVKSLTGLSGLPGLSGLSVQPLQSAMSSAQGIKKDAGMVLRDLADGRLDDPSALRRLWGSLMTCCVSLKAVAAFSPQQLSPVAQPSQESQTVAVAVPDPSPASATPKSQCAVQEAPRPSVTSLEPIPETSPLETQLPLSQPAEDLPEPANTSTPESEAKTSPDIPQNRTDEPSPKTAAAPVETTE